MDDRSFFRFHLFIVFLCVFLLVVLPELLFFIFAPLFLFALLLFAFRFAFFYLLFMCFLVALLAWGGVFLA